MKSRIMKVKEWLAYKKSPSSYGGKYTPEFLELIGKIQKEQKYYKQYKEMFNFAPEIQGTEGMV